MSKIMVKGINHYAKEKEGFDLVHDYVSITLGPSGKNLILDRGFPPAIITNDGVSIAKAVESDDEVVQKGVELIREVAEKTNISAGDGTTTSIVLAHALVTEGLKYSENSMDIRRSMELAGVKVVEELKKRAKPIKTKKELLQVAILAAESVEIGNIIADTFEAIGNKGKITVEESKLPEIESKIVDGYVVEKGFASPQMADKDSNKASYSNVRVMVVGGKLSNLPELLPFLQKIQTPPSKVKELVIFCEDIDNEIVDTFVFNKQKAFFNVIAIKCPTKNNEVLEDIAILTGAKFVTREADDFNSLDETCLGTAGRIVATGKETTILNGKGDVKQFVERFKKELPSITNANDYDLAENRIARLTKSIAVISVGAKVESDMRYLYYKVEDAVNAVKSAIEEGIVPGGGMTTYAISRTLGDTIGERIVKMALRAPLKRIIENAGHDYTEVLLAMPKGKGYDAKTNTYVDMIKAGIIDPVKVERCAIENSIGFAKSFLTSQGTIALKRNLDTE